MVMGAGASSTKASGASTVVDGAAADIV
eukprot:COSAG02_NODE_48111_length_336_cov_0.670886_1_plen_27_part_01